MEKQIKTIALNVCKRKRMRSSVAKQTKKQERAELIETKEKQ